VRAKTKQTKAQIPFDAVLFAARVPTRNSTTKDLSDAEEHKDDAVEPRQYDSMEDMVEDL